MKRDEGNIREWGGKLGAFSFSKKKTIKTKQKFFRHCLESKFFLKINFPNKILFVFVLKFLEV